MRVWKETALLLASRARCLHANTATNFVISGRVHAVNPTPLSDCHSRHDHHGRYLVDTTSNHLPSEHFLNLAVLVSLGGGGVVDTTTLAAHDFDVNSRTGFMPSDPPIARLPKQWKPLEAMLEHAMRKFQLAIRRHLSGRC